MQELKIKRDDFTRIDLDIDHYYYSLKIPDSQFEICLEPCAGGFDVSLYNARNKVGDSLCTNSDGYLDSPEELFGDRKDEDWKKAVKLANNLLLVNKIITYIEKVDNKGNDLISGDEIIALRTRAKTITMKVGLRLTMQDGFVPVVPMNIKSGYCVSLTIIENPPDRNPIDILSVGSVRGIPDPAESESIAMAVLGKGYTPLASLIPSSGMVHFFKRRT